MTTQKPIIRKLIFCLASCGIGLPLALQADDYVLNAGDSATLTSETDETTTSDFMEINGGGFKPYTLRNESDLTARIKVSGKSCPRGGRSTTSPRRRCAGSTTCSTTARFGASTGARPGRRLRD